ncbi:transcriptional regulator [Alicyclobacillaceae bacterium I2511]|nr:transcriptional regulator [Alicyclobacillaceae bacterium I2511]
MKLLEEAHGFLKPLVKALAAALGNNCEVVLHDLYDIEHSIVAIENGHITGRKIGDSSTNLGLEALRKKAQESDIYNYMSRTKDGKTLRSSSIYIRNDEGLAIGSICINYNITDFLMAANVINEFTKTGENVEESYVSDISDIIEQMLDEAVKIVGKPVAYMQKEDKLKAIEFLDEKGFFTVKRAMERVAQFFDVSKFTIYNYLDEIRATKERTSPGM